MGNVLATELLENHALELEGEIKSKYCLIGITHIAKLSREMIAVSNYVHKKNPLFCVLPPPPSLHTCEIHYIRSH